MKYTYLGHSVYIKESVGVYLSMCKELKKINEDVNQKLNNTILYNGDNHFETLVSIVLSSVSEGVSTVVNSLNRLGWNISEKEFVVDNAECFEIIISVLEKYEDDYYRIIQEIAGMEAYRNIRQATRGRFMGGGQGIDGIITGALTAEVANLVVGAGYTVANFIGNVGTRLKVEKKTQDLTKRTRDLILKEKFIEVMLKNLEVVFLQKCSHPDSGVYLQEYDTNHTEYNVIPEFLNIRDVEQKRKAYFSILESLPYCPMIYKILLMEYGDFNKELYVIAKDYDIDLDKIKKELLRTESDKLSNENGNIIEQMSELESKYSYYDNQLEQEIYRRYLKDFIADNHVDYLSQTEVAERVYFLEEFSKKYKYDVKSYIKSIKECIVNAHNIDLLGVDSLHGLKLLEEKIARLSETYKMDFSEYMNSVQNKISKVSLENEKEEIEKRTVYDVSEISMKQGIIRKRKILFDTQEEAREAQKKIDEICNFFDEMNFEILNKKLLEEFKQLQEMAKDFPYCEKIITLIKTMQSINEQKAIDNNLDKKKGFEEVVGDSEVCTVCGLTIKGDYRFCPKCGHTLLSDSLQTEIVETVTEKIDLTEKSHQEEVQKMDKTEVKSEVKTENNSENKQET